MTFSRRCLGNDVRGIINLENRIKGLCTLTLRPLYPISLPVWATAPKVRDFCAVSEQYLCLVSEIIAIAVSPWFPDRLFYKADSGLGWNILFSQSVRGES